MGYLLLIFATLCLLLAHLSKIERQQQFIEIYEKPSFGYLSRGLSVSYIINLILPFKVGNLFRIIYPGKKMKNGVSFSLATIIIDLLLDFLTVAIIYAILYFFKFDSGILKLPRDSLWFITRSFNKKRSAILFDSFTSRFVIFIIIGSGIVV